MKRSALAIVVLLLLAPRDSLAADPLEDFPDPAAAQNLVTEARALMRQSKYSEACPKLEESLRLESGIDTRWDLADCDEHIGKVTAAWKGFLEVAALSKAAKLTERERVARKRAHALETRLPLLLVEVPNAPQGLEVKRDGIAIDTAEWGTAIPVDPGKHRVTATLPGKQRWLTTVQSTEGTTTRVEVPWDLPNAVGSPDAVATPDPIATPDAFATPDTVATPDGGAAAPPEAGGAAESAAAAGTTQYFPPPVVDEPASLRRTIGWVVAGVGVVGIGVGAGFGLASLGKHDDSRAHCVGDSCSATGVSLRDDAIQNGNIATAATILGAAALAGGLVLMLTAPKRSETRETAGSIRVVPTSAQRSGGLVLQGTFR